MKKYTQAELDEILTLHKKWLNGDEDGKRADFREADFSGFDLSRCNLSGCDFSEADLRGANLSGSNLRGAILSGCDFSGANLRGANLNGSNLSRCNLSGCDFSWSNLSRCNLSGCDFGEADLSEADLDYSVMNLRCSDLTAHYDDRQIIQQLYHVLAHCKKSKNATKKVRKLLKIKIVVDLANEFHRVSECGEI